MARYLRLVDDSNQFTILIEAAEGEYLPESSSHYENRAVITNDLPMDNSVQTDGSQKAGAREMMKQAAMDVLSESQKTFESNLSQVLNFNSNLFLKPLVSMKYPPAEVEVSFDLKVSIEAGVQYLAVTKASGEANYGVKMVWKDISKLRPEYLGD